MKTTNINQFHVIANSTAADKLKLGQSSVNRAKRSLCFLSSLFLLPNKLNNSIFYVIMDVFVYVPKQALAPFLHCLLYDGREKTESPLNSAERKF